MSHAIPLSNRAAVDRALLAAFGTTELDAAVPLSGGLSGALIFRIGVGGIAYLLRIEGTRDVFRDPARWYRCMEIAAGALLAPRVHYADAEDGVAIMEFIQERSLSLEYAGTRADLLAGLGQTLRALHAAPAFPRWSTIWMGSTPWSRASRALACWRRKRAPSCLDCRRGCGPPIAPRHRIWSPAITT